MSKAKGGGGATVDVRSRQVARVYAEALMNAADKQGRTELLLEQLNSIAGDLFAADPLAEQYLGSGAIRRDVKRSAIERAFGGQVDPLLANFLQVLNNHGRLDLLRATVEAYRELHEQRAGRMPVRVRSAVALTDEQRTRLERELRDSYKREPILDIRVDPTLLGGMIVQVGDRLFDSSVKTRLERLRNQLMASTTNV